MEMKAICPCPNLDCPNHGYCDKCISRHLRLGHLNFCAFQTVLPALRDAIALSPESPTAKRLQAMIDMQQGAYAKLMEKHGITAEKQGERLKQVAEYGSPKPE
jgi:hypothetical protein